jgi:hypothetical protein
LVSQNIAEIWVFVESGSTITYIELTHLKTRLIVNSRHLEKSMLISAFLSLLSRVELFFWEVKLLVFFITV